MSHAHGRELDRKSPSASSVEDFASSGPFELFTLFVLTVICAAIYVALPRLLSSLYGDVATHLFRPTISVLLCGLLFALVPKSERSNGCAVSIVTVSLVWAICLKYGSQALRHDIEVIERAIDVSNEVTGYLSTLLNLPGTTLILSKMWVPVIASSLIEFWYQGALALLIVTVSRERSRRTKLPTVFTLSAFFLIGLVAASILIRYKFDAMSYVLYSVVALAALAAMNVRSLKALLATSLITAAVFGALHTTNTLACSALPGLLQCVDQIGDLAVRAQANSVTGHIAVVENAKYRLMKADHSLLGGEWQGDGTGQSIFTTFYMQSLAIYAFAKPRTELEVLQIGLGIGTSTKALLKSPKFDKGNGKIHIDVVELDPKVIEYAHDYFELPRETSDPRLTTYTMNALDFCKSVRNGTYDLVSHDIFTGGSLAFSLFTAEFFRSLKDSLTPGGILSLNYVYSPAIAQQNFAAVVNTLRSVFTEVVVYVETGKLASINNLVFFCSDTKMSLRIPISGRDPTTNFGQTAQNMHKWQFPELLNAVPFDETSILHEELVDLGDSRFKIRGADQKMALEHWRFMRDLLPPPEDKLWTAY